MYKLFIVLISLTFFGCNNSKTSKNVSKATGWAINAGDGSFQYNTDYKGQKAGPGLVFIEGGTYTKGKVQDDVMRDWNNTPNQQHVMSFYMDETEVTNMMYLEYLDWIKKNFPPTKDLYTNIYSGALPDTLVWRNRLGNTEDLVENYLRNPAYGQYPVVGVSWVQATEFAKWRSDRYNERILIEEGYLVSNKELSNRKDKEKDTLVDVNSWEKGFGIQANFSTDTYVLDPNNVYGTNNKNKLDGNQSKNYNKMLASKNKDADTIKSIERKSASRETGLISPKYRLPSESEWEYAALALSEDRVANNYRGRKKYPWSGQYTRNGKRKELGDQLANFKNSDGDYGGIGGYSDDGADITNEVKSYRPNDYGLYDMAGNVSEWVADVYRPTVDDEFNDFNYYRGNVYTKNKIGSSNGNDSLVIVDKEKYKILPNGKKVAIALPGEIAQTDITKNDTRFRTNYSKGYNINFRDGDKRSSKQITKNIGQEQDSLETISGSDQTKEMYNSPRKIDKNGNWEYDGASRTSLINDEVRVYKGGSWKDRAYWLDPAQRRFYAEGMSTDFIGFRCAMSRVGGKKENSNGEKWSKGKVGQKN